MILPELDYYRLTTLAATCNITVDMLDNYFSTGQLKPSFMCPDGVELYEIKLELSDNGEVFELINLNNDPEPAVEEIFEIGSYGKLSWNYCPIAQQPTANLATAGVFLHSIRRNKKYTVAFGYLIKKDDLIVTSNELKRLESNNSKPIQALRTVSSPLTIQSQKKMASSQPSNRIKPLSAVGNKGPIKTLILGGLKDYHDTKGCMPEDGKAFTQFLTFIYKQYNSKPKPEYFNKISEIRNALLKNDNCIKKKGAKNWYSRKYVESQFSTFKKEFVIPPKIDSPEASSP
ncbi:MAG: hypothetical protein PHI31_06410 [Desulfuromonadaceae bacterium]|nr:hypothetical protein [Desulfuromonadaceae bacterium]